MKREMSPPFVATTATVLARVIASGTHSAWVCVAIQGRAARSGRTWTGWYAAPNACRKLSRSPGAGALACAGVEERLAPVEGAGPSSRSIPSAGALAAR